MTKKEFILQYCLLHGSKPLPELISFIDDEGLFEDSPLCIPEPSPVPTTDTTKNFVSQLHKKCKVVCLADIDFGKAVLPKGFVLMLSDYYIYDDNKMACKLMARMLVCDGVISYKHRNITESSNYFSSYFKVMPIDTPMSILTDTRFDPQVRRDGVTKYSHIYTANHDTLLKDF